MSIVTLAEMKTYLGIGDASYDAFLTRELGIVEHAIANYCGRIFESQNYTQTIYSDNFESLVKSWDIYLYHWPVTTVTSINIIDKDNDGNDTTTAITNYRLQSTSGQILRTEASGIRRAWFDTTNGSQRLEFTYDAGFTTMPDSLKSVVYSIVSERYNKELNGLGMEFGSDVQRVSIPGVVSIDFDYTLQANERNNAFGMILGNYLNILDFYRSERAVLGEIHTNYMAVN